jgi:hypothetical protein
MVSLPVERESTDYCEYTGRTAAVEAVEVLARVSGYLIKVNFREGAVAGDASLRKKYRTSRCKEFAKLTGVPRQKYSLNGLHCR